MAGLNTTVGGERHRSTQGDSIVRRVTALTVTILASAGLSGLAAAPAFAATAASHAAHPGHARMNISFASGQNSSAHWVHRQQAVLFNVGADTGGSTATTSPEFAEIVVHHFPDASAAQAPTFTVTGPGSPYLEIDFSNGGYLRDTSTGWSAYDSTGAVLASATDYASALTAEQGSGPALTVDGVALVDAQAAGGPAYIDTITALQYTGVTLVPRSHHHGPHR
jgi:hypothetical protein